MYNGIGLQTPRGSGTNGYIQTNKFFVKPKTGKVANITRGYDEDQGTAGITKKPNKEILEHDRKRQIHLKLMVLEDKLIDQGYTDAEIAEKLEEARMTLEAAAASEDAGGPTALVVGGTKVSDTQSHQIAARKEKQMETLRAALGIGSEPVEQISEEVDDASRNGLKNGANSDRKWSEKREHAFLDREFSQKKRMAEDPKAEKDSKKKGVKSVKDKKKEDEVDELKNYSKKGSRKKRHIDDSSDVDSSDSDTDGSHKHAKGSQKKGRKDSRGSDSESETDSDTDASQKRAKKSQKKHNRGRRGSDSESETDSDDRKKHRTSKIHKKNRRYDSISSDSASTDGTDSENDKRKKVASRKQKVSRRHGGDSSASDEDGTAKVNSKHGVDRSRQGHDSDDDFDLPRHRTEAKTHMITKRHDSEDEFDVDGELERKSLSKKLGNQQSGSQRTRRDNSDVDDHWKSNDRHSKSSRNLDRDNKSDSDRARRHKKGSDDESEVDGELERKSSFNKLGNQQTGSRRTQRVDSYVDDRWNGKSSRNSDTDSESDSPTALIAADTKLRSHKKGLSNRGRVRGATDSSDSDDSDSMIKKSESTVRHNIDGHGKHISGKKTVGKQATQQKVDSPSDDSSYSDKSSSSDSESSDSEYKRKEIVKKNLVDEKRRDGIGANVRTGQSGRGYSPEEKDFRSGAANNDDRRRAGNNDAHRKEKGGLTNDRHHSRKDDADKSSHDNREMVNSKRNSDDGIRKRKAEDDRGPHLEKKSESDVNTRSYDKNDERGREDYTRSVRSKVVGDEDVLRDTIRCKYDEPRHGSSSQDYKHHGRERRDTREDVIPKGSRYQDEEKNDEHRRRGKADEAPEYGSRRRARLEEEERGSKVREGEKHRDSSKRARYDDSRSSERRRYENDKRDDDRSRYRD